MQMSSTLCYAEEAHQRKLAAECTLVNVRAFATKAAAAWNIEARAAEGREGRQLRSRALNGNVRAAESTGLGSSLSENPDRGFADA